MTILRVGIAGASITRETKQRLTTRLIDASCDVEVGKREPLARVGFQVRYGGGRGRPLGRRSADDDRQERIRRYLASVESD